MNRGLPRSVILGIVVLAISCSSGKGEDARLAASEVAAGAAEAAAQEIDWAAVDAAMRRNGVAQPGDVHRYNMPRSDLNVTSRGIPITAPFALGSWIAFKQLGPAEAVAVGDLVLTESELNPVMARLQQGGVGQTAVHKHLPDHSPAVWWMHVHARGNPVDIARAVAAALERSGTPAPAAGAPAAGPLDLDTTAIRAAIGYPGRDNSGVYNVSIPRAETIRAMGAEIPASMGLSTVINFQPIGGGRAAVNGDFVLTPAEVGPVLSALQENGVDVVSLHNHLLDEEPRLLFAHFWAADDAVRLARALRVALGRTSARPASEN